MSNEMALPSSDGPFRDALESLRALSEAASPGPWEAVPPQEYQVHRGTFRRAGTNWPRGDDGPVGACAEQPDADLAVAAVNYVRALLGQPTESYPPPHDLGEWPEAADFPGNEHRWVETTDLCDPQRHFMCTGPGCGESKVEPHPQPTDQPPGDAP